MTHYSERKVPKNFEDTSYMQSTRKYLIEKIANALSEPEKTIFMGLNNIIIFFDRNVDSQKLPDSTFDKILKILQGRDIDFEYKERLYNFLETVDKLPSEKRRKRIYYLLREHFENSIKNVKRRYQVLDANKIEELRTGEHPTFTIETVLLFPKLDFDILDKISRKYTMGAKMGDDMTDFQDDVKQGFLYVPKKHVNKVKGIEVIDDHYKVTGEPILEKNYIQQELKEAKRIFKEGDLIARGLNFPTHFEYFRGMMYSWIEEAEEEGILI
ncbi:MAG: hypothetical protein IB618_02460 [Candidatus Pacearchaeota archaeon]|nr:MAG: hypothetical protein IB618_02460 [Candidatus Pacearchaeota archaeon]